MADIAWKDYIKDALSECTPLNISLHYENMDAVTISTLTVVNRKIVSSLINQGATAIAIGVCDYSREALAFTVGMAIDDALRGRNQIEYDTSSWEPGDIVSLCGFNFEFVEFSEDSLFGPTITYVNQKGNSKASRGLSYIPGRVQRCLEESKPTSKRKGSFQDGIDAYKALSENEKILHDSISLVDRPIILSTSQSVFLNVPPTKLKDAMVSVGADRLSLQKCIKTGYIGPDGVLKESCEYDFEGRPSVISICRDNEGFGDLYYALEYIENGGKPSSVVIEAPEPEAVDGMFSHIEDIIAKGVPVVIFCDERTLRKAETFDQLGFSKIDWTLEALKNLKELTASSGYQLTHREMCSANRVVRIEPVTDPGNFPVIAKTIYGINSNRMGMSEKGQQSLSSLNRLLSTALKQTEIIFEDVSSEWIDQIEAATEILCDSAYDSSLSSQEIRKLRFAAQLLRNALSANTALPKEDVAYHALRHSLANGRSVCLVTSNAISARESSDYWKEIFLEEGFNPSLIRALTPHEFLKQECTADDEDIFVSGWFNRDTMDKLVNSALSSVYSIFLYRGDGEIELETDWYLNTSYFWIKHRNKLVSETKAALKSINLYDFDDAFIESDTLASSTRKKDEDNSISKFIEIMDNERALREKASEGEESHLARPVYFTDGKHKWLRVPDASIQSGGDTLVVVEGLQTKHPEFVRKAAISLHEGDIVLRMDTDDDALENLCKQTFGSYEETLRIAKSWRKPIDVARRYMSDTAIKDMIVKAGSKKTDQTILSWIHGDIAIAPNNQQDIAVISRAFNNAFSDEQIDRITKATKIVRGNRINTGKSISSSIVKNFIADVSRYGQEKAVKDFSKRHGLGTVELLCVDHIGKAQIVSISHFGYYID